MKGVSLAGTPDFPQQHAGRGRTKLEEDTSVAAGEGGGAPAPRSA
jgi:hypothetical protein